jgi:hypothetical protein
MSLLHIRRVPLPRPAVNRARTARADTRTARAASRRRGVLRGHFCEKIGPIFGDRPGKGSAVRVDGHSGVAGGVLRQGLGLAVGDNRLAGVLRSPLPGAVEEISQTKEPALGKVDGGRRVRFGAPGRARTAAGRMPRSRTSRAMRRSMEETSWRAEAPDGVIASGACLCIEGCLRTRKRGEPPRAAPPGTVSPTLPSAPPAFRYSRSRSRPRARCHRGRGTCGGCGRPGP